MTTKPRVLMLSQRFPYPPNRGDRIRSYNLLRFLARYYDVTIASASDEEISAADRKHVEDFCSGVVVGQTTPISKLVMSGYSAFLKRGSLTEGFFYSREIVKRLRELGTSYGFDAVLVFCSSMYQYLELAGLSAVPQIVDLVDVDSQKWRQLSLTAKLPKRWIYSLEASRIEALEKRISNAAFALTFVSDDESNLFRKTVCNVQRIYGISNGVDTDYFHPTDRTSRSENPLRVVFTGVMDYTPNVEGMLWFCREVMPELEKRIGIELQIVGRNPTSSIRNLDNGNSIRVTGTVPDVRPYLSNADIAISPLALARGIQNKVLEAMACGLPVVVTPQSAEGIAACDRKEFYVASSADSFIQSICELALNSQLRSEVGKAARRLVETQYSWAARLGPFKELLDQAILSGSNR